MRRTIVMLGFVAALTAGMARGEDEGLPNVRRVLEDVRNRVCAMPTLLGYYGFADLEKPGLTFFPGPGKGTLESCALRPERSRFMVHQTPGRWESGVPQPVP